MKTPEKKSINIERTIHREIELTSVRDQKDMYVLIREAWELYRTVSLRNQGKPEGNFQASPDCNPMNKIIDNAIAGGSLDGIKIVVPQKIAPWIPKLIAVLQGPARRALESNLETFAEYTELKAGAHEPPPGHTAEANATIAATREADSLSRHIESSIDKRHQGPAKRRKTA